MVDGTIRGVVFDFGGVFTLSEVSQAKLREYDAMLRLPPDTLQAALYSGEPWELASTGRISEDTYWRLAGQPYEDRLPIEFRAFRQGLFWAEPINEAMVALARRLRKRVPLALCSNALPELEGILAARPDLAGMFDVTVISALAGLRKPDAAIFHLVANRLALPIENCLLIDDKIRNIEAAQAAGMQGIVFSTVDELENALISRGVLP